MDQLEIDIRAASVLSSRRGDPLSERAERELAALLATAPAPASDGSSASRPPSSPVSSSPSRH